MTKSLNDFRCSHCKQLQFKWKLKDDIIIIEIKCYACNSFSEFSINSKSFSQKTYDINDALHEN